MLRRNGILLGMVALALASVAGCSGDAEGTDESMAGASSGGKASGGKASGGEASGGKASGGKASGGEASGGKASGGSASGGKGSGGKASGGDGSGGEATVGGTGGLGGMGGAEPEPAFFERVSTFFSCRQLDADCDTDEETAAEIVTVSADGMTVIYSDGLSGNIGFVDLQDPEAPQGLGLVDVGGEATSVFAAGDYVLAAVNTSPDYLSPSGHLSVLDIQTRTIVRDLDLAGQPDSVAVSPDGSWAAVVIENERDEELTTSPYDGLPQLPAGRLVVVDLSPSAPADWTVAEVALTGLEGLTEASDPEPEFVSINADNVAVVTFQENNGIALVDLPQAEVIRSFGAGTVDLSQVDVAEDGLISQTETLSSVPREPDGVAWIGTEYFATADEGDWLGGSRSFTVFDTTGEVVFNSGNRIDQLSARFGHYPEGRSESKGAEPENVAYGEFGSEKLLFVTAERSSLTFVYEVSDPSAPVYKQVLPGLTGPEGGLAIPSRGLVITCGEEDERGTFRGGFSVYAYGAEEPSYPTIESKARSDGTPIAWGALSGLAGDPTDADVLYAVYDSAYGRSTILTLDTSMVPAEITEELVIVDTDDVLANTPTDDVGDDAEVFSSADLSALINSDKSVNLDPEGIAVATGGGFWVVSEGAGTFDETADRPIETRNMLLKVSALGVIEKVVRLPEALEDVQLRFGFEGVAEDDGKVYVAFQRVWAGDSAVRLGIYDVAGDAWSFVFYPLDDPESVNGGWVGLSDLTALGDGKFLVLERDNQMGPDAAVKRIYSIDLSVAVDGSAVDKTLVRDLLSSEDLPALGGQVPEKLEGLARDASGHVWIVNDNDGVDDNSGETVLLELAAL